MNTNKIQSILNRLDSDVSIEIDGNRVSTVAVSEITGEPNNEVVRLEWNDCIGYGYYVILTEEGIDKAEVREEGSLLLDDHEGNPTVLHVFKEVPVRFEW